MDLKFKRKHMEKAYESTLVEAYKDYLETPDGREVCYDYLHHKTGGGAGILMVDEDECVYLVRLYRNSIDRVTLEIPAGAYSGSDESGRDCAMREVEEETGMIPGKLIHLSNIVSSIGTYDEQTDIFIGLNLSKGTQKLDPNEFMECVKLPITEALSLIEQGEIVDSKTVLSVYAYLYMKSAGKL